MEDVNYSNVRVQAIVNVNDNNVSSSVSKNVAKKDKQNVENSGVEVILHFFYDFHVIVQTNLILYSKDNQNI